MNLKAIEAGWNDAAREDPLWNILTEPGRQGGGWTPGEFFEHGEREIDAAMSRLDDLDIEVSRGWALDFGCGAGRLTQALARHFEHVDGVDISAAMVEIAREFASALLVEGCAFYHNTRADLSLFGDETFDFAYSMIVLQHMPRHLQRRYVAEICRVLRAGGVAMIEIPDGADYAHPNPWLSMFGTPRHLVEKWLKAGGCELLDVELFDEPSQWECLRYTARRA